MFTKDKFRTLIQNGLFILIGMLLAGLLLSTRITTSSNAAQAAGLDPSAVLSPSGNQNSPQAETWILCTPVAVAAFDNRVHVECAASIGGVRFFATPNSNPAHAARVLSVLTAAQMAGRTLNILYDPADTSGTDFGCLAADCRKIHGVGFGQ